MICKDIAKSDFAWLKEQDTIIAAAKCMADQDIGFLPVLDPSSGRAVGTLTDRDIAVRAVAQNKSFDTPLSEVMSEDIISCNENDDVAHARELMADHQIQRLLVTEDDGKVCGILSLSDLPSALSPQETSRTYEEIKEPASLH